jgi:hypothetical protein
VPEIEWVEMAVRVEYGLIFEPVLSPPTVTYEDERLANGVLDALSSPGRVVKRTVYLGDWEELGSDQDAWQGPQ